jgi:hypothetical protein
MEIDAFQFPPVERRGRLAEKFRLAENSRPTTGRFQARSACSPNTSHTTTTVGRTSKAAHRDAPGTTRGQNNAHFAPAVAREGDEQRAPRCGSALPRPPH